MPQADSMIARTDGHQLPGDQQFWIVRATDGTRYYVGFDNEFVKKHLFVDPPFDPGTAGAKAARMTGSIDRHRDPRTKPGLEPMPPTLDAAVLQFLKLKRLLFVRKAVDICDVCHRGKGEHVRICTSCNHTHKAWMPGKACGAGPLNAPCPCIIIDQLRFGGLVTTGCAQYVDNDYATSRRAKGLENPLGASHARIGGDRINNGTQTLGGRNSVILMSHIEVQHFRDVVVAAIRQANIPQGARQTVDFLFGPNTVAEINATDDFATFAGRQKMRGARVTVHHGGDTVYRLQHWDGSLP